jgi:surface polysaccharide O-acyltransferase-like enzyme
MFLRYVHNFRAIAILCIVIGHYTGASSEKILELSASPNFLQIISRFFDVIFFNGTVYFVFIAGWLFQHLSHKYQYQDYLIKKAKYVILPYVLCSLPALFLIAINIWEPPTWFAQTFGQFPFIYQIFLYFATGATMFHLWFIPMIAVFYLISPLLIKIDKNSKNYWLLTFLLIVPLIVIRDPENANLARSFLHFFPIYLLGMFGSHYKKELIQFLEKSWFYFALFALVLIILETFVNPRPERLNVLQKTSLCLVIIYGLQKLDANLPNKLHQVLDLLANFSFGIYFIHAYFLNATVILNERILLKIPGVTEALNQPNLIEQVVIATIFIAEVVINIASCIFIILLVRQIFKKNSRYLVGC